MIRNQADVQITGFPKRAQEHHNPKELTCHVNNIVKKKSFLNIIVCLLRQFIYYNKEINWVGYYIYKISCITIYITRSLYIK